MIYHQISAPEKAKTTPTSGGCGTTRGIDTQNHGEASWSLTSSPSLIATQHNNPHTCNNSTKQAHTPSYKRPSNPSPKTGHTDTSALALSPASHLARTPSSADAQVRMQMAGFCLRVSLLSLAFLKCASSHNVHMCGLFASTTTCPPPPPPPSTPPCCHIACLFLALRMFQFPWRLPEIASGNSPRLALDSLIGFWLHMVPCLLMPTCIQLASTSLDQIERLPLSESIP